MQRIRWKGFEIPTKVELVASTFSTTEGDYGKFVAEPFERGFGATLGNALRRALLSSIEGVAPVSARIKGAQHEFSALSGVREDVVNVVMNIRGMLLRFNGEGPETISVERKGVGPVLLKHFKANAGVEFVNPEWQIATLEDDSASFSAEIEFRKGRGYVRVEDFAWKVDESIGTIPMPASFSPIRRAHWTVESTRVGKMTNHDRLILEVWTNGVVSPEKALIEVATILRKHLNPFVQYGEIGDGFVDKPVEGGVRKKEESVVSDLDLPVAVLDLSVRAGNCMSQAGIKTIGELTQKTETEMLKYPNFGKTTLKEVKLKLEKRNLSFVGK